jgi:hypothetical protein
MGKEEQTLRRPVGVDEGECKRTECQGSNVLGNAGGEMCERRRRGIESEREIPGQVYHRLAW